MMEEFFFEYFYLMRHEIIYAILTRAAHPLTQAKAGTAPVNSARMQFSKSTFGTGTGLFLTGYLGTLALQLFGEGLTGN